MKTGFSIPGHTDSFYYMVRYFQLLFLAIGEAIGDISRVGIGKLIITIILVVIILIVIVLVAALIMQFNNVIGAILLGIASVYFVFFYNRAVGLLYSGV